MSSSILLFVSIRLRFNSVRVSEVHRVEAARCGATVAIAGGIYGVVSHKV
jgi:hypothetical protein